MFYLQARVNFQEPQVALIGVEEFAGAHTYIVDCFKQASRVFNQFVLNVCGKEGSRGFFEQFLVTSLQSTVTGGDYSEVTKGVTGALGFYVAGVGDELFKDLGDSAASSSGGGALDFIQGWGGVYFFIAVEHGDAATTAAVGALKDYRVTITSSKFFNHASFSYGVGDAGDWGDAGALGHLAGTHLVPQSLHSFRGRTDPGDTSIDYCLGKLNVFSQEAIAGVNCLSTRRLGKFKYCLCVGITTSCRQCVGFIC